MKLSHPENFNITLAQEVLGHIKINPELYQQTNPARCLIGWAGRLEGGGDWVYGGHALGLTTREKDHIFMMLIPFWAKARLRNFIRQAQSYRAEQEELRQRVI